MPDMVGMSLQISPIYPVAALALLVANGNATERDTRASNGLAANAALMAPQSAPSPAPLTAPAERIGKSPDGLFYVTALVNGIKVRFLVDSGANIVVLTPEDARRAGVTSVASSGDSIETAGGESSMSRTSIDRIEIAGRRVANVDAAVMRDGVKVSLLGQNLLSKLDSVTMSGDEMVLK